MNNIMLDLETMGTSPNAAIVSIGACFFDIKTRDIGPRFYCTLNLDEVVRTGGEMDASTVLWWMEQSDEARRAIYHAPHACEPDTALADFSHFVSNFTSSHPIVWGNGASMYRRLNHPLPWQWWNDRCYRTIVKTHPNADKIFIERNGTKHHALDGAIHQARTLIALMNPDQPAEAGDSIQGEQQ